MAIPFSYNLRNLVVRKTTTRKVAAKKAECDLRPAKVQQNISGRLTSEKRTQDRGDPWMPPLHTTPA